MAFYSISKWCCLVSKKWCYSCDASWDKGEDKTTTQPPFTRIISARIAIGHEKDGNYLIVSSDGKSYFQDIELSSFAAIVIQLSFLQRN